MGKGSHKPTKKETWDVAKEFQREEKGGVDSTRQFREAEHQARDDAADTDFKVRDKK